MPSLWWRADDESLKRWAAAGFNTTMVKAYLTLLRSQLDHGNIGADFRVPAAFAIRQVTPTFFYLARSGEMMLA